MNLVGMILQSPDFFVSRLHAVMRFDGCTAFLWQ